MNRKKISLLLSVAVLSLSFIGCMGSPGYPHPDLVYFTDVYLNSVNGTAYGGGGGGPETDPIWGLSPSFGITAGNIVTWNAHPPLTTGTHGVTGTIVGTSDVQSLTNKQLTMNNGDYIWWKNGAGVAQPILFLGGGGFNVLNPTGNGLNFNYDTAGSIYLWGSDEGTGEQFVLYGSNNATALQPLRDSPTIQMGAWYWDGAAPAGWAYNVIHDMFDSGAAPKSQAIHSINGVPILTLININGQSSIYGNASSFSMTQVPNEPGSTANRAGIYAWDLSADNATIGFYTETAVETALGVASTNRIPIRWNGQTYYLLAEASGFYSPLAGTAKPTVEQGLRLGLIFLNTDTHLWEKCTSLSPVTWETLPSGSAAWGAISGTLSAQTDLQGVLDAKETPSGAQAKVNAHTDNYTHANIAHSNRSVLDNIQEAFTTALKSSYDSAVTAMHSHANKATLDNITEAFTTSLKSTYDTCASAFTSAYKTTLDTFMASKGSASGLAPLDGASKVPTVNLGGAGADNTKYLRGDQTWVTPSGGSDPWTYLKLTTDFTTTSATAVDVTGLAFTPSANTRYDFEAVLMIRTATATVNPRVGLAWATGMTDGVAMIEESQTASAVPIVANGNINAALLIAAGGIPNTTQSWPVRAQGMVVAGASPSGTVRIQLASETAGTTVRIVTGSYLKYRSY